MLNRHEFRASIVFTYTTPKLFWIAFVKIIFAGTEFAATALAALLKTSHEIIAVYTQPDRKSGRGQN